MVRSTRAAVICQKAHDSNILPERNDVTSYRVAYSLLSKSYALRLRLECWTFDCRRFGRRRVLGPHEIRLLDRALFCGHQLVHKS